MALGGYAAEKIIFNDLTTGAANDIKVATDVARALVTKYGMSEKIGPVALGGAEELVFLGREISTEKSYSEEVAKEVDEEVSKFMNDAEKTARDVLKKHSKALDAIAKKLIEKETIEREEFDSLIKSFGIKLKKIGSHKV